MRHERKKGVLRRYRAAAAAPKSERRERDDAQGSLFLGSLKQRLQQIRRPNRVVPVPEVLPPELEDQVRRRIGAPKIPDPDWDRDTYDDQAHRELTPPVASHSSRAR